MRKKTPTCRLTGIYPETIRYWLSIGSAFSHTEREILHLRWGDPARMESGRPLRSHRQVAQKTGLTPEGVRRVEGKALLRLCGRYARLLQMLGRQLL